MVILAEELLLLAYNDDTGRNQASNLELGLAGGLLLDLTLAERIDLVDKHVRVVSQAPIGHPLLDEALQRMSADKPRKPKAWVDRLHRRLSPKVLSGLVEQRVLSHDADTVLGFIPFNRYRPQDPRVESEVRARLENAVALGKASDARTAALAALIYALNLERKAFPNRPRRETRKVLKSISEGSWAADATRKAIEATQAAVMAAITASVVASSSAGASGGN